MSDRQPFTTRPRDLAEARTRLRALLPELKQCYSISYLGVFGSWARGEQRDDSDPDLLVDFDGPTDGFAYVRLQDELSHRLALERALEVVGEAAGRGTPVSGAVFR